MLKNSELLYKVYRDPMRDVCYTGYRGDSNFDTAMFFAPYRPGCNDEYVPPPPPTQFQLDVFESIRTTQNLKH